MQAIDVFSIGVALIAGLGIGVFAHRHRTLRLERERYIRAYVFPRTLLSSVTQDFASLSESDLFLVARALRQFFLVHLRARGLAVGMPSKAVDALWHAFILDTRAYHGFCERAFGGYFHHIPAARMRPGASSDAAMRVTWRLACLEENIPPKAATRLPLLFAIDEKLGIPGGNVYSLKRPEKSEGGSCGGGSCGGYACSGDGLAGGSSDAGGDGGCGGGGCGGD